MYYFYVLQNKEKELYYGYTHDLRNRLKEHMYGKTRTTKGKEWALIYYEAYRDKRDAREREKHIKQYGQAVSQLKRRIKSSMSKS